MGQGGDFCGKFLKRGEIINALAYEKSLYLRQHAHQPVDWRPWSQELLTQAKTQERPLFISIGYSACHWCHVMARESFEDEEIATLLNENFIPVKIDREEHPEIDAVYLLACEITLGNAGWPLTVIALPDGWPIFVATYLPKEGKSQRLGLKELLISVSELWRKDRPRLLESAQNLKKALRNISFVNPATFDQEKVLEEAFNKLSRAFDRKYGGFGLAPKFPLPLRLLFLLRYGVRQDRHEALEIVRHSLLKMRFSGIFDQVGLGFHRYAIDRAWKIPHFEKMLYDQGLLIYLYAEAAYDLNEPVFAKTAEELARYLKERLISPEGLFFSAESAESEGEEGKFYTWSYKELEGLLTEEEFKLACAYFDLKEEGNYLEEGTGRLTGRNILHPVDFPWRFAQKEGLADFEERLKRILKKLEEKRKLRPHPERDEKIITSWNALAIAGLAHAGKLLADTDLTLLAKEAFSSLWAKVYSSKGLLRVLESSLTGLLEDYVYLTWAAFELYENTKEKNFRESLAKLLEDIERLFKSKNGLYRQTNIYQKPFLIPYYPIFEGALPGENAILAGLFGALSQKDKAQNILHAIGGHLRENPAAFPTFLLALL